MQKKVILKNKQIFMEICNQTTLEELFFAQLFVILLPIPLAAKKLTTLKPYCKVTSVWKS